MNKNELRAEAVAHGLTEFPLAVVCRGPHGCVYLPFLPAHVPAVARPNSHILAQLLTRDARWFSPPMYGLSHFSDLFTSRQLTALTCLAGLIEQGREQALIDGAGKPFGTEDGRRLREGSQGLVAYADALAVYLACALSRLTDYSCSLATWNPTNENIGHLFQRQAIPMVWDFAEANLLSGKITFVTASEWVASALASLPRRYAFRARAVLRRPGPAPSFASRPVVSTDPPYFDNIGYAGLSDFFYVWLRLALASIDPEWFTTTLTPKDGELIASRCRQDIFRDGFAAFCRELYATAHPDVPVTLYYAVKQSDAKGDDETEQASPGWEAMLSGLASAGFQVTGAATGEDHEEVRSVARGTNVLASAIVIVCRRRPAEARASTHEGFLAWLRRELPREVRTSAARRHRPGRSGAGCNRAGHGPVHAVQQGDRARRLHDERSHGPATDQPRPR